MIDGGTLLGRAEVTNLWLLGPARDAHQTERVVNCSALMVEMPQAFALIHALQASDSYRPLGVQCSIFLATGINADEFRSIADAEIGGSGLSLEHAAWHVANLPDHVIIDATQIMLPQERFGRHNVISDGEQFVLYLRQRMDMVQILGHPTLIKRLPSRP